MPDKNTKKSENITRKEFAEAFQKRKQAKGDKPFFYFNTSCNGIETASSDVAAVQDKSFVVIGSKSYVTDFNQSPWSPFRQILHGVRSGQSYTDIAKTFKDIPNYNPEKYNGYVFPNQPEYNGYVTSKLAAPTRETISITRDGQEYHFERAHSEH